MSDTIFGKKKITGYEMSVLICCTNFAWKISHSKNNRALYDHKCVLVFT